MDTYSLSQRILRVLRLLQGLDFGHKLLKGHRDLLLEHGHSLCYRKEQMRRDIDLLRMAKKYKALVHEIVNIKKSKQNSHGERAILNKLKGNYHYKMRKKVVSSKGIDCNENSPRKARQFTESKHNPNLSAVAFAESALECL